MPEMYYTKFRNIGKTYAIATWPGLILVGAEDDVGKAWFLANGLRKQYGPLKIYNTKTQELFGEIN